MGKKLAFLFAAFLLPALAFAQVTGSFVGGYQSCYQYGVDMPQVQINYTGTSDQVQVHLNRFQPSDDDRYVAQSAGSSPYTSTLDFSREYDGSNVLGWFDFDPGTQLPYHVLDLTYYADSEGESADIPVDFVIQAGPCAAPPAPNGISAMIAYADATFASTTGFTVSSTSDFAGDTFFNLFAGAGLAALYEVRYWVVAILIISAIVYFSYRALRFFKH